jgi:hypothetical protein
VLIPIPVRSVKINNHIIDKILYIHVCFVRWVYRAIRIFALDPLIRGIVRKTFPRKTEGSIPGFNVAINYFAVILDK